MGIIGANIAKINHDCCMLRCALVVSNISVFNFLCAEVYLRMSLHYTHCGQKVNKQKHRQLSVNENFGAKPRRNL